MPLGPFVRNSCGYGASAVGALLVTRSIYWLRGQGQIDKLLSRKLAHIGAGCGFVLTWPLYAPGPVAGYVAATVPLVFGMQTALVGAGVLEDKNQVLAASRSGKATELLYGPVAYASVISFLTAFQWMKPSAVVAIFTLAVGDGVADIVGRRSKGRFGPLPWNKNKTWGGSLSCWGGGFVGSSLALAFLRATCPHANLQLVGGAWAVFTAAGAGTLAESLPFVGGFDNLFVALAAGGVASLLTVA